MVQGRLFPEEEPARDGPVKRPAGRVIRASEIGEYIYCHRAWWLHRVQGVENANRAQLEAGIARHRAHNLALRRARQLRAAAVTLATLALVLAFVLLVGALGLLR